MIIRKIIAVSILVVLGVSCAGAVLALYNSVNASARTFPEALYAIPSEFKVVFGINVQKLVKSPIFSKFQEQRQIGSDLATFIEKTGLDPLRDLYYIVGASRPNGVTPNEGLVIATGQFNKDRILSYMRSKDALIEKEYGGETLFMIPDTTNPAAPEKGIVFLNEGEIALGDLQSIKATLDIRGDAGKSILSNDSIAVLLQNISTEEMFWFAGDTAGVLANARLKTPLLQNASTIKTVFGALNLGDAVTGKIIANADNAESATKLADGIKGLIALGQLTGTQNPELKSLLGGLAVSQNSTQVTLALNIPADVVRILSKSGKFPAQPNFR